MPTIAAVALGKLLANISLASRAAVAASWGLASLFWRVFSPYEEGGLALPLQPQTPNGVDCFSGARCGKRRGEGP